MFSKSRLNVEVHCRRLSKLCSKILILISTKQNSSRQKWTKAALCEYFPELSRFCRHCPSIYTNICGVLAGDMEWQRWRVRWRRDVDRKKLLIEYFLFVSFRNCLPTTFRLFLCECSGSLFRFVALDADSRERRKTRAEARSCQIKWLRFWL